MTLDYTALENPMPLQCCQVCTDIYSERFPYCWYRHAPPNAETANMDKHESQGVQHDTTYAALGKYKKHRLEDAFHTLNANDANSDHYSL